MHKILLTSCLLLPSLLHAATMADDSSSDPFPNAKPGINILSFDEIKLPSQMKKEMLQSKNSLAAKGFDETTSVNGDITSLYDVEKNASKDINYLKNDDKSNPENSDADTRLKASASDLSLAFNFKGVPNTPRTNVIGFAVAGGYTKQNGWDGAVEFIKHPDFGVCSYTTFKIEKVILTKENIKYLVNKKPTIKQIAGNKNLGFLYSINWYTPTREMSFECANKKLDYTIMDKMIVVANEIDKQ